MEAAYYVYILQSQKTGRYYIGHTHDVKQRLRQHNLGVTIATRSGRPWKVVHFEKFPTKAEAARRERDIKRQKSRDYVERLMGVVEQS